jgi:hypothetical protein
MDWRFGLIGHLSISGRTIIVSFLKSGVCLDGGLILAVLADTIQRSIAVDPDAVRGSSCKCHLARPIQTSTDLSASRWNV